MSRLPDQYLTPAEAAYEFGVSDSTLRRLARAGHLHRYNHARDTRRRLYSRHELVKALTQNWPAA